jgi:hypothetical protein
MFKVAQSSSEPSYPFWISKYIINLVNTLSSPPANAMSKLCRNAQKLSRHPSLQIGGCYEVHDIEDLVRVGQKVKGLYVCLVTYVSSEGQSDLVTADAYFIVYFPVI